MYEGEYSKGKRNGRGKEFDSDNKKWKKVNYLNGIEIKNDDINKKENMNKNENINKNKKCIIF